MPVEILSVAQSAAWLLCPGTKPEWHTVRACTREAENQRMMLQRSQKGALQVPRVSGLQGYQEPIGPFALSI